MESLGLKSLFDQRERSGLGPARQSEGHFEYLNRTGRSKFRAVRELMDDWWHSLPPGERGRIRAAFRSGLDSQMMGAFWELYLHQALKLSGCRIRFHPQRRNAATAPDFKALGRQNFYLEGTRFGPPQVEVGAAKRRGEAYDRLDDLGDPNFMVHLDIERDGVAPIDLRRLERKTRAWLADLDPDTVQTRYSQAGWRTLPTLFIEQQGWRIELQAYPIRRERRGIPGGSIGGYVVGDVVSVYAADVIKKLQSTVRNKALRYGRPRLPLVIAVLEDRDYPATEPTGMMRALFEGVQLGHGERLSPLFGTIRFPKLTRVSAVIGVSRLVPWTVATYQPVVWHNPYASLPFESPFPWQQVRFDAATHALVWTSATKTPSEFFGLEEPWPPAD